MDNLSPVETQTEPIRISCNKWKLSITAIDPWYEKLVKYKKFAEDGLIIIGISNISLITLNIYGFEGLLPIRIAIGFIWVCLAGLGLIRVTEIGQTYTLTVNVTDENTGDPVVGAQVWGVGGSRIDMTKKINVKEYTDNGGVIAIGNLAHSYTINIDADNYKPTRIMPHMSEDKEIDVELEPKEGISP